VSPGARTVRVDRVCQAIDRSENKRRVVISRAKTELESWLAAATASPPDSVPAVTEQTIGMINDAVTGAVVNALKRNGYQWTAADHVVNEFPGCGSARDAGGPGQV